MGEFLKKRGGFVNILVATAVSAIIGLSTFIFNTSVKITQAELQKTNGRIDKQEVLLERLIGVQADIKEILGRQDERIVNIKERVLNLEKR